MHRKLCPLFALLWGTVGIPAILAEPFVPEQGAQILEQVRDRPLDSRSRELRTLRISLTQNPNDLDLATRAARRYIEESRVLGDPRYLGYAQAALRLWWSEAQPPTSVLLLRATIRQSNHQFEAALADLSQLLESSPDNVQAWITQATILQVIGDYDEAAKSCAAMSSLAPTYAAICSAGVAGLSGRAAHAYDLLAQALTTIPDTALDQKVWVETGLAEIATRLGRRVVAQTHFERALQYGATDPYLKATYADFLLDAGRPDEVVDLLRTDIRIDALVLRLALAEQLLGASELPERIAILSDRFDAARARGDRIHMREEARFFTQLLKQPEEGLRLAQANWAVQKEPADARILLEASMLSNAPQAAQPVIEWMRKNKLEDAALNRIIQRLQEL